MLDPSSAGKCMTIKKARNNNLVFFWFQFKTVNTVTMPKIAPDAPAEIIVPRNKFAILVEIPDNKNTRIRNTELEIFSNLIPKNHKKNIFKTKCNIARWTNIFVINWYRFSPANMNWLTCANWKR